MAVLRKLGSFATVAAAAWFLQTGGGALARPEPASKPVGSRNSDAIRATFDAVRIDDDHHLLFYYVLNNLTDQDYRIADGSNVVVMAKRSGKSAPTELSATDIKVFYPIVLPAKQRHILVMRDLRRTYRFKSVIKEKENPTPRQEQAEEKRLEALIDRVSPGFHGFVIFDKATNREIDLPKGW